MITGKPFRIDGVAERGAALVELALILPMLVLVMAGGTDFARVFYTANVLTNAARAGTQYGAQSSSFYTNDAGMQAIAQNIANANLSGTAAVITSSHLCECASAAGTFSATSPANTCSYTCTGGGHIVIHVTVSAAKTFSTIFNSVPGIPATVNLTRSATLRAQ